MTNENCTLLRIQLVKTVKSRVYTEILIYTSQCYQEFRQTKYTKHFRHHERINGDEIKP